MVSTLKNSVLGALVSMFAIAGFGAASPVFAATDVNINIPVSTVIRGPEGSAHQLASEPVNPDYRGMVCSVSTEAENQSSVHPGNNLVVASGTDSVVLEDVERESGVKTTAAGELTLGETITVTLVMGEDKVFSAGMTVDIHCEDPQDDILECSTLIRTSQEGVYTYEAVYNVQNGATVEEYRFSVNGEQVQASADPNFELDASEPGTYNISVVAVGTVNGEPVEVAGDDCTAVVEIPEEGNIIVCRDDEIIEIKESELRDTDTTDLTQCEEEEEPEEPKVLGKELPNTGPGAALMTIMGLGGLGTTARAYLRSKKNLAGSLLDK